MKSNNFNPDKHHRRSIRLKGYDYSQAGLYFITLCTYQREMLFGDIIEGRMLLNDFGRITKNEWIKTGELRNNIQLDSYIVMPNHFHGIIKILGQTISTGTMHRAPTESATPAVEATPTKVQFGNPTSNTNPTIIRSFKAAVTNKINALRQSPGVPVW